MKHGSTTDLLDLFENPLGLPDSFFDPMLVNPMFSKAVGVPVGSNAVLPPPTLPDESIEAESAQNGPGGPGSVVAEMSGGLVINLLFDAAAMAAPTSFRQGIEQAATILSGAISDKITVNLNIDYSGTGGGAAAGPDSGQYVSYTTLRADLIKDATPGDMTFNALPSGSTIQGQSSVAVWNAQLKLLGSLSANDTTTDDGSATFATDINPNLLVGVALHELTHAMGRVPYGPQPDIFDLFRFTSPGTRLLLNGATAPAAYFSLDGGTTKVADYGQTSDASDFLNSGVQGSNDPFNEFYSGSTLQQLTTIDLKQLDALGFHLTSSQPTVIESNGSTSLVQVGNNYFVDPVAGGTGPELKVNGAAVTAGQFGAWIPVGAEQTSSGYEVAWKYTGADQYLAWATDSSGNFTSNIIGTSSGSSTALESLEPGFHQDLNGDGVIGIPATVIESYGSTSLVQVGNNYFVDPVAGGTGPELKVNGAVVTAGQFGAWIPVGAEQTSSGYEVAWKYTGADQYLAWATDSSGNFTSNIIGTSSGSSTALESLEPGFHQDLNGDGVIGIPATVIESYGSTSLVQVGNNYFVDPVAGGTGPELKVNGAVVTAGQFGAWIPVGAEQTSSGYEVAWKYTGADQYLAWATDSSGNFTSNIIGTSSGSSTALESLEPGFHQDLNGDGVIGIPATVIESYGSTSLVQVGNNYFVDPVAGGTGPELKVNGAVVTAGQFGAWIPVGAEQTSSGYEVAWKYTGADQYLAWATDSSGNFTSNIIGTSSGSSTALESLEPGFHQDLNGDGVIGIPAAQAPVVPTMHFNSQAGEANSIASSQPLQFNFATADQDGTTFIESQRVEFLWANDPISAAALGSGHPFQLPTADAHVTTSESEILHLDFLHLFGFHTNGYLIR